jgi:hypothetical protein
MGNKKSKKTPNLNKKPISPEHKIAVGIVRPPEDLPQSFDNFLISGSGRSGTRFLANLMDRSEIWTVKHEPGAAGVENYTSAESIGQTYKRFEFHGDHYGEVNSMLRRILIHFPVRKKGVMIRNPYDVYLSIANRRQATERKYLDEFIESLGLVNYAISKDKKMRKIVFEKLTTDVDYAQDVLKFFGIDDVVVTEEDIKTKVNQTHEENRKYKSIKDLPADIRKEVLIHSERFLEKHPIK